MSKKRKYSSFRAMSTERKLESVFLFVTGRCNAKCAMCFYTQEMDKKQPDLTFEEIKRISETAGEFNRLWIPGVRVARAIRQREGLRLRHPTDHAIRGDASGNRRHWSRCESQLLVYP